MLNLEKKLKIDAFVARSSNLCDHFSDTDLTAIGQFVHSQYLSDVQSREKWERRSTAALDLAMQVQEDKNLPWPGCSNVKFPLVTIAALQFHSRAYPALIDAPNVVRFAVVGEDPDGKKAERAARVENYMNWHLLDEDESWEEQWDRALLYVPIVGVAWKKTYYNAEKGHASSDLVLAKDLVINYWAKSVEECPCKTHILPFSKNMLHVRIMNGSFRDVREESWYAGEAPQVKMTAASQAEDNRQGETNPQVDSRTPFVLLEQHCWLDLDQDGYAEPYIVTIESDTQTVLRIVARWNREEDVLRNTKGEIVQITASEFFTKIPFIPSPDGGIMDIGFGTFLGPLNESVNTAINQLIDSGTMANTAGGFLGRGAKIRGGVYSFNPFEWNRVDSTGDDLRKAVIPLPVREPSNVLFNLLSLLVTYTEKVSGSVDITTGGNPGQNTPAETGRTMVEQGGKVYGAIFKRVWRSMRGEFRKLYQTMGEHFPTEGITFAGAINNIKRSDLLQDPSSISPQADPYILSDQQRFLQAQAVMQVGRMNPLFSQEGIYRFYLRALKLHNIDSLFLGMEKMQRLAPPEKMQVEMMKANVKMQELQFKKLQYVSSLFEQRSLNEAKIINLYAQAALAQEQAGGVKAGQDIEQFRAAIESLKTVNDTISNQISEVGGEQYLNQQGGSPPLEGEPGYPMLAPMGGGATSQPPGAVG